MFAKTYWSSGNVLYSVPLISTPESPSFFKFSTIPRFVNFGISIVLRKILLFFTFSEVFYKKMSYKTPTCCWFSMGC